jgi:hypothetical protein
MPPKSLPLGTLLLLGFRLIFDLAGEGFHRGCSGKRSREWEKMPGTDSPGLHLLPIHAQPLRGRDERFRDAAAYLRTRRGAGQKRNDKYLHRLDESLGTVLLLWGEIRVITACLPCLSFDTRYRAPREQSCKHGIGYPQL